MRARHRAGSEAQRQKWLDGLSDEARNRLSAAEKQFSLRYTILVATSDLAADGDSRTRRSASAWPIWKTPRRGTWKRSPASERTDRVLLLLTSLLTIGVSLAVPLLLAALGELIVEKAGVINVGIEGMMLAGALAGFAGSHAAHSPWLGALAALGAGVFLAVLFSALSIGVGADQVVVGRPSTSWRWASPASFSAPCSALRVTGHAVRPDTDPRPASPAVGRPGVL